MIDKRVQDLPRAVADVKPGSSVMIGGFGEAGLPSALIDALVAHGAGELTVISNNAGQGDAGIAALLKARLVRKVVCSFPRQVDSYIFDELYRTGRVELELVRRVRLPNGFMRPALALAPSLLPPDTAPFSAKARKPAIFTGGTTCWKIPCSPTWP